jgi:hypothetical protein
MLCCILSAATLVSAQIATTSLRGVVKDPSGALVPGAKVTLVDKANGTTLSALAGNSGFYVFPQIPPARYSITVSATGFANQTKIAELLVNQPATVDFTLSVQVSAETVDVSDTAQTLNTTDATLGDSVGNVTIEALPMEGRDPISLLTLQPGVLYLGNPEENSVMDSRSGSVSGGRSDQGNITLDGMDDNDQIAGTAFTGVLRATLDSTEEFRVTTANGTADSGRSSGAQVSIVTKSGTNQFHGALYEYYRPTNTVANQWFNKLQQLSSGEPNRPQKYVMNTFGGSVGGPIKKDKLFFFFNYEGQRRAISDVVTSTLPTAQFYQGELGYQDSNGDTQWLSSADVATLDAGCNTNVACGVNQNVQAYFKPLSDKGFVGTMPSVGDGINNAGYVFTSPNPHTLNTSIVKIDYTLSNRQHVFFRGNLQKDTTSADQNLPGQPPASVTEDNTKGMAFGHTWTPTSNIVNDLRYGFIRQGYSTRGVGSGTGDWVVFRFLNQPTAWQTRTTVVNVPVENIVDNFTLTRGKHTVNLGGNWRGIENNRGSDANSYSGASTNPYWMNDSPNDPCILAEVSSCATDNNPPNDAPLVGAGFTNSYAIAYATLVGTVPETTQQYNYEVTNPTSGKLLTDGVFIDRHFKANEFEYYLQDAWRVTSKLTVTFGVRQSILQAPYETKGQQISPTVDTHAWFAQRGKAASQGQSFEDTLSFEPSGKANHQPGYWAKQKANFAPRLAAVYAPDSKTSIRMGGGMYFDHFGQGIVNSFDQLGSFGLSNAVISPAGATGFEDAPRFTGPQVVPPLAGCPSPATTITYPFNPSTQSGCNFAITWGIDNHLKTPYAYSMDLSVQRELPAGFTVEANYVGRLGRHLLEQLDLAQPVNLVDPKGGGDYFAAADQLSKDSDSNGGNYGGGTTGNPPIHVQTIQYFEDVFPQMANLDYLGESATDGLYNNEWAKNRYVYGETQSLADVDFNCYYGCPNGTQFWQPQFSSLYAWSSIGTSSYNALQVTLRHPTRHGLTADINYTLSKSLDMGSGAERSNEFNVNDAFGGSAIQNSWNPKLNKGLSDFDTHHLVTIDWVYEVPVGRGKTFLASANRIVDAVIGQWQFSGLSRWSSGLPFSVSAPVYTTDWQIPSNAVVTAPVKIQRHIANGVPQVFAGNSATTINNGVYNGTPIRLAYPGEAGQRNNFRGDGYFDIDSSLAKTWKLHDRVDLKFAGEVYNVGNNVRFDCSPLNLNANLTQGTFGAYSGMLSTYRRMQFGLRLDF